MLYVFLSTSMLFNSMSVFFMLENSSSNARLHSDSSRTQFINSLILFDSSLFELTIFMSEMLLIFETSFIPIIAAITCAEMTSASLPLENILSINS